MSKLCLFVLTLTLLSPSAQARQSDDLDALRLADNTSKPVVKASDWQLFAEAGWGRASTSTSTQTSTRRLSLDLQYDSRFAPDWRAVFSNRLDVQDPANGTPQSKQQSTQPSTQRRTINSLREAYLSWQRTPNTLIDVGRINAYQGVANGYNPTDFFKEGALRSVISVDPASLKKNRLGSVMLRAQQLWDDGALTAIISPKLGTQVEAHTNHHSFSPDLGASNAQTRLLLTLSQKISSSLTPQWHLYAKQHQAPQLGMSLSALPADNIVAYLDYAGGRSAAQTEQWQPQPTQPTQATQAIQRAWHNRLATGITYTNSHKLSLNIEYDYNGSAPNHAQWQALRRAPLADYGRYRLWQQSAQELATQQELFIYANWQDAGLNHLDLAAMQKINLSDHSKLTWLEARYHLDQADLALQWQKHSGENNSAYGAALQRTTWQMVVRVYF